MGYAFDFAGLSLQARASGALWWPKAQTLIVSDLHLGRSIRVARKGIGLLPPYEVEDTLTRLEAEIAALKPKRLISLGDAFDDMPASQELEPRQAERLRRMTGQHEWIWISGNHDPAAHLQDLGGEVMESWNQSPVFRHIMALGAPDITGHMHPVMVIGGRRMRCFVVSGDHLILPAFGAYVGGLDLRDPSFSPWARQGLALICGRRVAAAPVPREK